MSETSRKAVFLSYASQDADAARKIAETLCGAGVEVWFDQEALVGGDAWDQQIRRRIKECALFVPVISANTQARREGYFRLEWKLADDRTHLMARGTPFLLPVCVDDTKDGEAIVPDSFMTVQWTRLPAGTTPVAFCQRVENLLEGEVGARPPPAATSSMRPGAAALPGKSRRRFAPIIAALAAIVLLAFWQPWRTAEKTPTALEKASAVTGNANAFPRDPALKRAMDLINGMEATPEDFALAEELTKNVLAKNSTDPEAVIVMARVQVAYSFRGFDRGEERRALARRYAERAHQLAPDNAEALGVLGVYHLQRSSDPERARELLERAIALKPTEPFFHRHRDNALFTNPKVPAAEALAAAEGTAARFPHDALSHYELARHYRDVGRVADFERELDRTLAIVPLPNAMIWKSRIALWQRGDVAEMKALLDRVPARVRAIERIVISRWAYAMASGDYDEGLAALASFPGTWIEDFEYNGPKALLVAQLLDLKSKPELARLQHEAALLEIRARHARTPGDAGLRGAEAWVLHGLGRDGEAQSTYRVFLETVRRPYRFGRIADWWFTPIPAALRVGERATALQLIREAIDPVNTAQPGRRVSDDDIGVGSDPTKEVHAALRLRFRLDPRMARFREDPEIAALLKEPAPGKTVSAPAADPKSVAVLAFRNSSDDKSNEYFSDGISEELLNVLAKVPDLKVSARTSAFHFKGKDTPIPEIARQLGVAYVVEGSVRKDGNRVRITAQLIKAADGFQVWSENFNRELKDIFAVQDEIAGLIARNLALKLGTGAPVAGVATKNLEAHDAYLRGRALQTGGQSDVTMQEAARLYEEARRLDPGYALAWARLAQTFIQMQVGFDRSEQIGVQTRNAARMALQLAPELPEARLAMAAALLWVDHDFTGAQRELDQADRIQPDNPESAVLRVQLEDARGNWSDALARQARRAVELDPQNASALNSIGQVLNRMGRFAEAAPLYQRSWTLSQSAHSAPRSLAANHLDWTGDVEGAQEILNTVPAHLQGNTLYFNTRAPLHVMRGDFAAAIADYERVREYVSSGKMTTSGPRGGSVGAIYYMARIAARQGNASRATELYAEALTAARTYRKDYPELAYASSILAKIHAARGEIPEALAAMDEAMRIVTRARHAPQITQERIKKADVFAMIGQKEAAIAELRAVHASGYALGYKLRRDPAWDPLRNDPKFQQLMKDAEAIADAQPRPKSVR